MLEDGRTFHGEAFGAVGETFGEAVFTTAMTGYQETLTDPSYHRQVVVQTAPHIGNTGVNDEDDESRRIWVAGYVVRDPSRTASNWRATGELAERLAAEGVVGIAGIDTRALTRHLRERGAMRAGISSVEPRPGGAARAGAGQPADARRRPVGGGDHPAAVHRARPRASTATRWPRSTSASSATWPGGWPPAGSPPTSCRPASTLEDLLAVGPDAVFFSPGPGDPATADHPVALARRGAAPRRAAVRHLLRQPDPRPGARLRHLQAGLRPPGHQPAGARPGHRQGRGHLPQPRLRRGRAAATGWSTTDFGAVEVCHVCLNDDVVEGLRCLDVPAFTVQYHPEAAAGPHDADYLFDRFVELDGAAGEVDHA